MSARLTKPAAVSVDGCLAHRCDEHEDVALHNANGPDLSECAMCLVEAFILAYEKQFEQAVFWPAITSARDRLNVLAPGAGDALLDEARAILNAASLRDGDETDALTLLQEIAATEPVACVDGVVDIECGFCAESADHGKSITHKQECLWLRVVHYIAEVKART